MKMKLKLIITISISLLCIAILLCSCNVYDRSNNQENHNSTISDVETEQPIVNVDYSTLRFDSKKEYDDFMDKNTISENFISYNMLKKLGEFDSMVFLTNTNIGDYGQYLYFFIDDSGHKLALYVESRILKHDFHTYKDKYTCIDEINSTDMRYIDITDKTCVYYNENLLYTYVDGKLNSIIWTYEDIEYRLSGTPGLFNYPNIETTFAGQLLHGDQANEALNEFLNSMNE